jgi:cytoskeletal protein RodZ
MLVLRRSKLTKRVLLNVMFVSGGAIGYKHMAFDEVCGLAKHVILQHATLGEDESFVLHSKRRKCASLAFPILGTLAFLGILSLFCSVRYETPSVPRPSSPSSPSTSTSIPTSTPPITSSSTSSPASSSSTPKTTIASLLIRSGTHPHPLLSLFL